jgi:hypothetical protein
LRPEMASAHRRYNIIISGKMAVLRREGYCSTWRGQLGSGN